MQREQPIAAAIVHRARSAHPDWSNRTLALYVLSRAGARRTSRAAVSGGIAGIPAVGTLASMVSSGADEAMALNQLVRMILVTGYAMTGDWVDLATSSRWVRDVLATVGHPASIGGSGSSLSPAARRQVAERAQSMTKKVAARTATASASKFAFKKLGKFAPLGATAVVSAAVGGTEAVRVGLAALRYFDVPEHVPTAASSAGPSEATQQ